METANTVTAIPVNLIQHGLYDIRSPDLHRYIFILSTDGTMVLIQERRGLGPTAQTMNMRKVSFRNRGGSVIAIKTDTWNSLLDARDLWYHLLDGAWVPMPQGTIGPWATSDSFGVT